MRRFVLGWKMFGLERTLGGRLVTYADDLVILCRRGKAEAALQSLREIMGKLKLTVSEEKTRICKVPEGAFDFLGYTFGRMFSARTGQARIGYRPSKKSIQRVVGKVHALRSNRPGTADIGPEVSYSGPDRLAFAGRAQAIETSDLRSAGARALDR